MKKTLKFWALALRRPGNWPAFLVMVVFSLIGLVMALALTPFAVLDWLFHKYHVAFSFVEEKACDLVKYKFPQLKVTVSGKGF